MDITVINRTEKHGVTYRLKEMFLTEFQDKASITEPAYVFHTTGAMKTFLDHGFRLPLDAIYADVVHTLKMHLLFIDCDCYIISTVCCRHLFKFLYDIAFAHLQDILNISVVPKCVYGTYHALNLAVTRTDGNGFCV